MPILIVVLCWTQIVGGISLLIIAMRSYKKLGLSVAKLNLIAAGIFEKIKQKYQDKETTSEEDLSPDEVEKLTNHLKHLAENIKLQMTMSFLSLYFIGSRIITKPAIPLFSTFIFGTINIICGVMLIQGGVEGWYLGIFSFVYALLRNFHALVLLPKLVKKLSHSMFKVKQFYIKYLIRCFSLLIIICCFFDANILEYFRIEKSSLDLLMAIEVAVIGFILLDFFCYKIEEWTFNEITSG